ncbi:DUF4131 domain-containing protein [Microvirga tunisiensis]|uniref:DUF4131 domain-containing protein n=1 Tax=Pannonibacter tanglangensis TaxID=2750084 RepID=A0A7X5F370_9HYPH|nr:ComEC/Rec2 family competence protein [Pannonibacter sp. XCT-53]NBN77965.1 DUF4131 domain-containing protein [Pannonibacter sp. XCT-53]
MRQGEETAPEDGRADDAPQPSHAPAGSLRSRARAAAGAWPPARALRIWWNPRRPSPDARAAPPAARRSAEDHRLLHVAFAFAAGVGLYFSLPQEPAPGVLLGLAGALAAWIAHRHLGGRTSVPLLLLAALACGLAAGALRTATVAAPVLQTARSTTLTGTVLSLTPTASGSQLVLAVETADGLGRQTPPARVRLSQRGSQGEGLLPGDRLRLSARLLPPSGPVRPGSYDFAFAAFYQGIGATGFAFGTPERLQPRADSRVLDALAAVDRLRHAVAREAEAVLGPGDASAIVAALLVGLRGHISEAADADLREAGLSHVLSISGLHMVLFAGGMYWVVLAGLALVPGFALRLPLHRIAAGAALLAATCYLFLSGASVPTQRSYLMIALVFIGLMTGRRGLSLRSVALAALVLLAWRPEDLFSPGFQMSFAAVICLIAAYDDHGRHRRASRDRRKARRPAGPLAAVLGGLWLWLAGLTATSLIAGLATGVIGAYHFDRLSPYGLVGNLLAMPAVSLLVMPAGVAAFLLQPLGLAAPALHVMGEGIGIMLSAARFTAGLSDTDGVIGALPAGAALALTGAVFWGFLAEGRWRLLAAVPTVAGLVLWAAHRPPDLYIGERGTQVAARDADGVLRVNGGRIGFAAEVWLTGEGIADRHFSAHRPVPAQTRCDPLGCVIDAHSPGQSRPAPTGSARPDAPTRAPASISTSIPASAPVIAAASAPLGEPARLSVKAPIGAPISVPVSAKAELPVGAPARAPATRAAPVSAADPEAGSRLDADPMNPLGPGADRGSGPRPSPGVQTGSHAAHPTDLQTDLLAGLLADRQTALQADLVAGPRSGNHPGLRSGPAGAGPSGAGPDQEAGQDQGAGQDERAGQDEGAGRGPDSDQPDAPPLRIALSRKLEALESDCARADILVTALTAPPGCAAPLIFDASRRDLGVVAIWLADDAALPDANQTGGEQASSAPAQTDLTQTALAQTDPAQTDPAQTHPAQTAPMQTDPRQTDPAQPGPGRTDPGRSQPLGHDPARPELARPQLMRPELVRPDPSRPDVTRLATLRIERIAYSRPPGHRPWQLPVGRGGPLPSAPTLPDPALPDTSPPDTSPPDPAPPDPDGDPGAAPAP